MPYKTLDNVAIADIAIEVEEPTLEKLFITSAKALTDLMISAETLEQERTHTYER